MRQFIASIQRTRYLHPVVDIQETNEIEIDEMWGCSHGRQTGCLMAKNEKIIIIVLFFYGMMWINGHKSISHVRIFIVNSPTAQWLWINSLDYVHKIIVFPRAMLSLWDVFINPSSFFYLTSERKKTVRNGGIFNWKLRTIHYVRLVKVIRIWTIVKYYKKGFYIQFKTK